VKWIMEWLIDYIIHIRVGNSHFRSECAILALLVTCTVERSKESQISLAPSSSVHLYMHP
jgi:hypothetical protein